MAARVALVTGGARGIGRAIVESLLEAGHPVAIADVRGEQAEETAREVSGAGGQVVTVQMDVTDSGSVAAGVERAVSELGQVEVLVNNVGGDELLPFLETDESYWDWVVELNFKGQLRVTRAVLPGMVERRFGRVVNVASDAGRVGSSLESVYSGAKGGVIAFTKALAREVARRGVTVNAVCPGPTDTPMLREMAEDETGAKLFEALTRAVPMRRLGEPEDVAPAVAFLASDRAGFITGQTLSVSGGLTMA
jgi:2-hydroxycyclohexanecarboxyl-CoA dehydrogenase